MPSYSDSLILVLQDVSYTTSLVYARPIRGLYFVHSIRPLNTTEIHTAACTRTRTQLKDPPTTLHSRSSAPFFVANFQIFSEAGVCWSIVACSSSSIGLILSHGSATLTELMPLWINGVNRRKTSMLEVQRKYL